MRFGVCAGLEQLDVLQQTGYDYCELGAASVLAPESPEDEIFAQTGAMLVSSILVPETFNLLLSNIRVTGPERDPARLKAYLTAVCTRAAALGGKVLVFGGGGQRRVPEGYDRNAAWDEIRIFLTDAADAAEASGIQIAIEPLNTRESNIITSVNEALEMADAVNRPDSIGVLADLYHMEREGEDYEGTIQAARRGLLRHVHVASGADRHAPREEDADTLAAFFGALKQGGYDARVSIEASWTDFSSEAAPALTVLRRAWNEAA